MSDLSFTIEKGRVYGLLGPNGAGKSTTMNMMTGCLAATSGEIKIDSYDIFEDEQEAKKRIGYLPEHPPLYLDRTPREYLTFVGRAKKIPASDLPAQIEHVMQVTQIEDVQHRLMKQLSKGYRQRVGIAQAILGDPEVIILDEPTVGLDPKQMIEIRELIRELGKTHTVILSSHILSQVQEICQTILIIANGKLVACDTPQHLEKLFTGQETIELVTEATQDEARYILETLGYLETYTIAPAEEAGCHITIESDIKSATEVCRDLFFAFAENRRALLHLSVSKASLEDIFLELTAEEEEGESEE